MFETKKGAVKKMLKEADKIQSVERFRHKMDTLRLAEEVALAAGDSAMLTFIEAQIKQVHIENHYYNLMNGLLKGKD